jgi:hypothetical protein
MAQTEFRSEIEAGTGFEESVTITMVAHDTSIALFGPVVLSSGSITDLPKCASTTTAGDKLVIGVCTRLPRSGSITADTSVVEVCVSGRCKVKVADSSVSLNDPLETNSTAGVAQVQVDPVLDKTTNTVAALADDVVIALNNIRKCFGIALTTVSSGANSIVLAHVGINHVRGDVTAA